MATTATPNYNDRRHALHPTPPATDRAPADNECARFRPVAAVAEQSRAEAVLQTTAATPHRGSLPVTPSRPGRRRHARAHVRQSHRWRAPAAAASTDCGGDAARFPIARACPRSDEPFLPTNPQPSDKLRSASLAPPPKFVARCLPRWPGPRPTAEPVLAPSDHAAIAVLDRIGGLRPSRWESTLSWRKRFVAPATDLHRRANVSDAMQTTHGVMRLP